MLSVRVAHGGGPEFTSHHTAREGLASSVTRRTPHLLMAPGPIYPGDSDLFPRQARLNKLVTKCLLVSVTNSLSLSKKKFLDTSLFL